METTGAAIAAETGAETSSNKIPDQVTSHGAMTTGLRLMVL
jgi:hypothetical protein